MFGKYFFAWSFWIITSDLSPSIKAFATVKGTGVKRFSQ
jgi:hypothetical protein